MPNWCDCTYKCVGDLKEVKSLYKILKYIDRRKTSIEKNGFGKWWLGNLVTKLGSNWEKYRCRGEITYYELNNNILTICQSTAWCEQEGVRNIIEEKFPSIKVYFKRKNRDVVYIPRMMQVANISRNVTTWIRAMMIRSILQLSKKRLNVFLR